MFVTFAVRWATSEEIALTEDKRKTLAIFVEAQAIMPETALRKTRKAAKVMEGKVLEKAKTKTKEKAKAMEGKVSAKEKAKIRKVERKVANLAAEKAAKEEKAASPAFTLLTKLKFGRQKRGVTVQIGQQTQLGTKDGKVDGKKSGQMRTGSQ